MARTSTVLVGIVMAFCVSRQASAQNATVTLGSEKQYIRGFGGMVHIPWAGDLTAAERTLAFGNAEGQLGFTVLRIAVPDSNTSDSSYVATAKAAIAAGGIVFASPWNGKGSMSSSDFSSYATHLSSFVSYMKSQGADLYAIGVQNEPDYGSQGGWRTWTAAQCHDFVLTYGGQIGTKLLGCESYNYAKSYYDPILNDSAALENLGVLGTHLYGTSVNNFPYPLFDQKGAGKERWMTEHYTDSNTDANSWPNALGVASELHNAMVQAQFNAYTWWYIKRSYGPINNGAVTKRGWCMAHWSKFVRPGFHRVDATASPTSGVSLSAYKGDSDVVIVIVNTNSAAKTLAISVDGGDDISSYDSYTTSSTKNLADGGKITATGGSLSVTLDAQSVTTLHGSGTVPAGGGDGPQGSGSTGAGGSAAVGGAGAGGRSAGGGRPGVGRDAGAMGGATGIGGAVGGLAGSGRSGTSTGDGGRSGGGGSKADPSSSSGGAPAAAGTSAVADPSSAGSGAAGRTGRDGPGTAGPAAGADAANSSGAEPARDGGDGGVPSESGCQCRIPGHRSNAKWVGLLGSVTLLGLGSLRRRSRKRPRAY